MTAGEMSDAAEVQLYYSGQPYIRVRGNATGRLYPFSAERPIQAVDQRDAVPMLQSRIFTHVK
ncbi:MAG TPA: hypothetical protein VMA34_16985 [Terracidiphilus sp.]|nr:hypothetical protein [Terracidiphilus sp.]